MPYHGRKPPMGKPNHGRKPPAPPPRTGRNMGKSSSSASPAVVALAWTLVLVLPVLLVGSLAWAAVSA
jgi:hypothetical protein